MIIHPPRDDDHGFASGPMGTSAGEYPPHKLVIDVRTALLQAGIVVDLDAVQAAEALELAARLLQVLGVRPATAPMRATGA